MDLDYMPVLGPVREALCVLVPALLALALYSYTGRWHGGTWAARVTGFVAAAACASLLRTSLLEREYKVGQGGRTGRSVAEGGTSEWSEGQCGLRGRAVLCSHLDRNQARNSWDPRTNGACVCKRVRSGRHTLHPALCLSSRVEVCHLRTPTALPHAPPHPAWPTLQAREKAYAALGDGDSRFRPIVAASAHRTGSAGSDGGGHGSQTLTVHVKVKTGDFAADANSRDSSTGSGDGSSSSGSGSSDGSLTAVHCFHGFGANLGSYQRVQGRMAAALRGVVTAHDMPGFGLTQRCVCACVCGGVYVCACGGKGRGM